MCASVLNERPNERKDERANEHTNVSSFSHFTNFRSSFLSLSRRSYQAITFRREREKKREKVMMNDNLYISSFLITRRRENTHARARTHEASASFNHTVCPIANGSSLKYVRLSSCEIESNPYSITCCRQMDGLSS